MVRRTLVLLTAVLLLLAVPGLASADPPFDRGRDVERTTWTEDCGDFTLEVEELFRGRFLIRRAPGDPLGQAFLASNTISFTTTATNPETGRSFTARFTAVFHELQATLVSSGPGSAVYDFRQRENVHLLVKGQGRPYIQEHVVLEFLQRFDTLGDGSDRAPGGTEISLTRHVVSGADFDVPVLCEVGAALTT